MTGITRKEYLGNCVRKHPPITTVVDERLLTFSVFRMGAYSRWALIRGWANIRINRVRIFLVFLPSPRKAIASLYRTLTTGQTLHKDKKYFIWPLFLKIYLCKNCNLCATYQLSPSTKYSSEYNSKFSFCNLIFRSSEIYYRTQWKEIFEISLLSLINLLAVLICP